MSHNSIRLLIENTALSLADNVQFTYARPSDFNVLRNKRYPFISCDPLSSTPRYSVNNVSNYMKQWSVSMAFYALDNEASDQDGYALILDEMDTLVDQFINKLNYYSDDTDDFQILSVSQTPFVKTTADILTGYILSFQMLVKDTFEYCDID